MSCKRIRSKKSSRPNSQEPQMSRDPRRIAVVAVMALGLSLSACGQGATGESAGTAPASTS